MRIFLTGATGWVGAAVASELLAHGHQVVGLCRSPDKAGALAAAGAEVLAGTLDDLEIISGAARGADAVIHTAFHHDFSRFAASAAQDARAIEAIGDALLGTDRPLLVTSGLGFAAKRVSTEDDPPMPTDETYPRRSEKTAQLLSARGLRASTLRLPPSVHGHGDHGFVPILIGLARKSGVSAYIGAGDNLWPAVHRHDAARAYRLAIESDMSAGPFNAVAEEGIAFRDIADLIGRRLDLPVVSKSPEEAEVHFGWFARFAGFSVPASSARTQAVLGWQPTGPTLLEDMDHPAYFTMAG